MKKVIYPLLLITGIIGVFIFIQLNTTTDISIKAEKLDFKKEIEIFTVADGEDDFSVAEIEKTINFNKNQQVVLFNSNEDKLGYAILEDKKILMVAYGDNKQGFDHYKDYFIVFGEKPNLEYTKLNLIIETKNHEDINKSVALGDEKYYLEVQELPEGLEEARVQMDNYHFE